MSEQVQVGSTLALEDLVAVARRRVPVGFDGDARARVTAARAAIDAVVAGGDESPRVYGVNTGFGALAETRISPGDIRTLQHNLLRSHSCGVGEPLPAEVVRAMMLLRAQVLALGYSGVRPVVVDTLVAMLNRGVHPVIPSQGSVGASGDLAPLAHLALGAHRRGRGASSTAAVCPGAEAMSRAGVAPIALEAKEGLSLINGTQFMLAHRRPRAARRRGPLAVPPTSPGPCRLEALKGSDAALRGARGRRAPAPRRAGRRAQPAHAARRERDRREPPRLRQGAGPVLAALHAPGARRLAATRSRWVREVLAREINSVTDNPLRLRSRRRRGRGRLRRQLPRPARSRFALDLARHGLRRARQHLRAPRRAAREPRALVGPAAVPRAAHRASTRAS